MELKVSVIIIKGTEICVFKVDTTMEISDFVSSISKSHCLTGIKGITDFLHSNKSAISNITPMGIEDEGAFRSDYKVCYNSENAFWSVAEAMVVPKNYEGESLFTCFIGVDCFLKLQESAEYDRPASDLLSLIIFEKALKELGVLYGKERDGYLPILSVSGRELGSVSVPLFSDDDFLNTMKHDSDKTYSIVMGYDIMDALSEALTLSRNCEHFSADNIVGPSLYQAECGICYGYSNFVSGSNLFVPDRLNKRTLLSFVSFDDDEKPISEDFFKSEDYEDMVSELENEAPCVSVGRFGTQTFRIVPRYYLGEAQLFHIQENTIVDDWIMDVETIKQWYSARAYRICRSFYYFTNTDKVIKKSEEKAKEILLSYL